MFLKTGELKKIMKSSLKTCGLTVGNVNGYYLIFSDIWGAAVETIRASNKLKAAIMEMVGDLPEPGECCCYTVGTDKELVCQTVWPHPEPYEEWKAAKDFATATPVKLMLWPHTYMIFQSKKDLKFLLAKESLTNAVISASELELEMESMPGRPSLMGNVLYFKNETTIWWVYTEPAESRVKDVLFPHLSGIDFFDTDWKVSPERVEEAEEETEEKLPY